LPSPFSTGQKNSYEASAANAIKVSLNNIHYGGGWSTNSIVLEAKYFDFAIHPRQPTSSSAT